MDLSQPVLTLQLRVLAGLHEGAVVPVQAAGELLLASHGQADVLLRDAPGQAWLLATAQGWLWREDGFEQAVQAGQAWRWAGVVLSLSATSEPWPAALPVLAFERDGPEARDTTAPSAVPVPGDPPAGEPPEDLEAQEPHKAQALKEPQMDGAPPQTQDASPPPARRVQAGFLPAGRAARLALAAAVAVLLILTSLVALLLGGESSRGAPPVSAVATATEPAPSLGQVQKVLMDLGLSASVKPRVREDGRLILRGVVADAEQLDALSHAISRLTRRYTPLLLTQSEFEGRVQALAPNLPEGIEAQPHSGGLLVLQARRDEVNWVLARQLVDGELPEVVGVEHRAFRPVQEREWVDERRARSPSTGRVMVAVPPPPPAPSVPWAAVVGGPRPYLVMADGSKWLPGGKMHSLVLVSIDDKSVVFQDAQGRTFSKPR